MLEQSKWVYLICFRINKTKTTFFLEKNEIFNLFFAILLIFDHLTVLHVIFPFIHIFDAVIKTKREITNKKHIIIKVWSMESAFNFFFIIN